MRAEDVRSSDVNLDALGAVLSRELRGLFDVPTTIAPTAADVAWFSRHMRMFTAPFVQCPIRGEEGSCWRNASQAMWHDTTLRYAQGFVRGPFRSGLIPHAWCVDAKDRVVEATWNVGNATGFEEYLGVVLTLDQLCILQREFARYSWYDGFADVLERRETAAEIAGERAEGA